MLSTLRGLGMQGSVTSTHAGLRDMQGSVTSTQRSRSPRNRDGSDMTHLEVLVMSPLRMGSKLMCVTYVWFLCISRS